MEANVQTSSSPRPILLAITAAKNERAFIQRTITSVVAQDRRPDLWCIVDDGSTDETFQIACAAAEEHKWIKVSSTLKSRQRRVGSAAVEVITSILSTVTLNWTFLAVIDADLVLPPGYFAVLLDKFAGNPGLGIASGRIFDLRDESRRVLMRERPEMTSGAAKCWRRDCLTSIGGLVAHPSWDALDCYSAMRHGWMTRTFTDDELNVDHLRPTGSSHMSVYQGRIRRGQSMYYMGAHPVWILSSMLYHALEPPYILGSIAMAWGYFRDLYRRKAQVADEALISFVRRKQLCTLRDSVSFFKS